MRRQNDSAIGLAENLEPLPDLVAEHGMTEHQPSLIQKYQARRAIEPLLDPVEEIGKGRYEITLAHVHELFNLEALERAKREAVFFRVEKLTHRPVEGIMMKGILDLPHLHAADKVRKRFSRCCRHQVDLA